MYLIFRCINLSLAFILFACANQESNQIKKEKLSPIKVVASEKKGFATLTHADQPDNRIGYRFFEHTPLVYEKVEAVAGEPDSGLEADSVTSWLDDFSSRKGVLIHQKVIEKDDNWIAQSWTFYLSPTDDGVDMLFTVQTFEEGLPAYYGIQQCFRMSGKTNAEWRQVIACTPAFSEYDLWANEDQKTSLTYVLRNNTWQALPADSITVGARTPIGLLFDTLQFGEPLPEWVGPYQALMTEPVDNGLITRINEEKTWVCGIFWKNTSHVTDHHPADCLHSIVNIGNVPPHSMRAIRGKIYWFRGRLADLSVKFERDF